MFRLKRHRFFTPREEQEIILAIRHAERQTSGEIRVHVQHFLSKDVLADAKDTFYRLAMDATKERNGVIFFLVPEKRQFAIYGDQGINVLVSDDFWDDVKEILKVAFQDGQFAEGLIAGIQLAGERLQAHFPIQSDDINELPDEISY